MGIFARFGGIGDIVQKTDAAAHRPETARYLFRILLFRTFFEIQHSSAFFQNGRRNFFIAEIVFDGPRVGFIEIAGQHRILGFSAAHDVARPAAEIGVPGGSGDIFLLGHEEIKGFAYVGNNRPRQSVRVKDPR